MSIKLPKDNLIHSNIDIRYLGKMEFIFGSVQINWDDSKSKKIVENMPSWRNQKVSCYDSNKNCLYIITGEISNLIVIDIDDPDNPIAKRISTICDKECSLIASTRKGKHYYFAYDGIMKTSGQYKDFGFDIRSNGGIIFCPPGFYHTTDGVVKYKFIKKPDDCKLTKISSDLFGFIQGNILGAKKKTNNLIIERPPEIDTKQKPKKKYKQKIDVNNNNNNNNVIQPVVNVPVNNEFPSLYVQNLLKNDPKHIQQFKELVTNLLNHISPDRNNTYTKWCELGMVLVKFGDFGISLWKKFSSNYEKYNEHEIDDKVKTFHKTDGIPFDSLLFWARIDDPVHYTELYLKYAVLIKFINIELGDIIGFTLDRLFAKGDLGLVTMYHDSFKNDIVYVTEHKKFYLFNTTKLLWQPVTNSVIITHYMSNISSVTEPLYKYYIKRNDDYKNDAERLPIFSKKLQLLNKCRSPKTSSVTSMLPLFEATFTIDDIAKKFNAYPDLLPVKNGIVDLKTGNLIQRTKNYLFTFELDVEWKGISYETPFIDKFIKDIMLDDMIVVTFLQKLLGYSITGYTDQQKFIIFWGDGGNGKTVLQNLLSYLLKDYYRQLTADVVIETNKPNAGSASPHLMYLQGSRIACIDENDKGARLNESAIKTISGGGAITARKLHGDYETFIPTAQIILLTNFRPDMTASMAIERRLLLIPFLAVFKSKENIDPKCPSHKLGDPQIEKKLIQHLDQFLVWLVKGSIFYFTNGNSLGSIPKSITNATQLYVEENDSLQTMIDDMCELSAKSRIECSKFIELYTTTYKIPVNMKDVNSQMKYKGFEKVRHNNGKYYYCGLKFKPIDNSGFSDDD